MFGINISVSSGLYTAAQPQVVEINMTEIVSDWRSIPGVVDYLANRLGGAESMEIEDMLISRSSASEQETLAFLWATQKQVGSVTSNHGRVRFI